MLSRRQGLIGLAACLLIGCNSGDLPTAPPIPPDFKAQTPPPAQALPKDFGPRKSSRGKGVGGMPGAPAKTVTGAGSS